jgi:hypothetical protein
MHISNLACIADVCVSGMAALAEFASCADIPVSNVSGPYSASIVVNKHHHDHDADADMMLMLT